MPAADEDDDEDAAPPPSGSLAVAPRSLLPPRGAGLVAWGLVLDATCFCEAVVAPEAREDRVHGVVVVLPPSCSIFARLGLLSNGSSCWSLALLSRARLRFIPSSK